MVDFNDIPNSIRAPGFFVEFDASRAVSGPGTQPHVVLLIGHSTTTALQLPFDTPTRIFSIADGHERAGRGSALANMIERYKRVDPRTELHVAAITDVGGGSKATGALTFVGTATEAGTVVLYVTDIRVPIAVQSGDTAAEVATAAVAEMAKDPGKFPVTASEASAVLTLTSRTDTTADNGLLMSFSRKEGEKLPAGITVTSSVALSGGTGDADVSNAVTNMGDVQYHTVVTQFSDDTNMDRLETIMLDRWGPLKSIEGHLFAGIADTVGNSTTAGNLRNSQVTSLVAFQQTPTAPANAIAQVAARDAQTTVNGPADPRQTLSLPDVMAPLKLLQWTYDERDIALTDGLATVKYDAGTGLARIDFLATTAQTNAAGAPDESFLSITTPRTLAFLRWSLRTRFASKFPRHKLAGDTAKVKPGQKIVTPRTIKAELVVLFREWENLGLVEDIDQFKDELSVEISPTNPNRVDVLLSPNLINQFRILAAQMQFIL